MAPTVTFSGRSRPDAGSFLAMGPSSATQQRSHGLRVRKQAEMMGITPGTSRLSQQTGSERWVSAAANKRPVARQTQSENWASLYEGDTEDTEVPAADIRAHAVPGHVRALVNDEFYEGDPFAEDEEHGQDVGEEDLLDEEYAGEYEMALDDEYEEYEEPDEEAEAPPAESLQTRILRQSIAPSRLIAKKEEGSKTTAAKPTPAAPRAALANWELFKVQKLSEVNLRDTGAKAICRIKNGLRQPGVQADGRPFIPDDWDASFKPVVGSFKKFILGRPDQFRIITGAEPGLFTIEIVSNETVVAPSLDLNGKGKKGKGDGKGKAKGKDGKGGKSWGKDAKGKGKDFKGKGKGKDKNKSKGWSKEASTPWTDAKPWATAGATPAAGGAKAPATRGATLLVAAAKEALAEEEEAREEEMGEDEWPAEEDEDDAPNAAIEDPIEQMFEAAPDEDEAKTVEAPAAETAKAEEHVEEDIPAAERPTQHGSFMSLLGGLGGLLGGKRSLTGAAGGPAKKRAL